MPACIHGEAAGLLATAPAHGTTTRLARRSRGLPHVAQVLGDDGGISYVCTACGHSWS
jgi:hypothetical protein